nr:hypothetical protein [Desulfobacterales bacterium]
LPLKYFSEVFSSRANASVILPERVDLLWWELQEDIGGDELCDNWKDIRQSRLRQQIARGEPEILFLHWGSIPFRNSIRKNKDRLNQKTILNRAEVWVRDADGRILQADFSHGKESPCLTVVKDVELNGLYLVGANLDIGEMDIDSDGVTEMIRLSAKRYIYHSKTGGRQGNRPAALFNDPAKFPLEIGCSDSWFRYANQRAYREYEMKVIYDGKPLTDTQVNIFSQSGWQKTVTTDAGGKFLITPFGRMEKDGREKYLYAAACHDLLKGEYHYATLVMNVSTYSEWRSKSSGFMLWTILGTGLLVIIIIVGIYRKKKHARDAITQFENQRIKKG